MSVGLTHTHTRINWGKVLLTGVMSCGFVKMFCGIVKLFCGIVMRDCDVGLSLCLCDSSFLKAVAHLLS